MAAVFFGFAFDKTKFAAHLRMVVERLRLAQNKRTQEIKQERREVSGMLAAKKMDKARVRVESVLRKTREGEASDILTVMVDLLVERVPLISAEKACPADLVECVATVLWAAPRAGIEELKVVAQQLTLKYGDKWAAGVAAGAGAESRVNQKVFVRLTNEPPADAVKVATLLDIAKEFGVPLDPASLNESVVGLPALDPAVVAKAHADAAGDAAPAPAPAACPPASLCARCPTVRR